ncbi:MAG: DUF3168 domain-containing protein [Pseudomonadota bacterium]|nr:DUF3168 domain-containing protein [Pseudomonadota bacterium]MDE3037135.1 DUF3168 domain-containing protein [Pseudomonadota bacterium]
MANFSHLPLQEAVYAALTGDATLMALVSGVFDRPPEGTAFPYVTLGESTGSDWSSAATVGMEHHFTLHVWSREGGRKQSASIMERLHTLLHQANLSITGQTLVMMVFSASEIVLENDGWTYHGKMQFHALLQAN